jgi:hypothetical protein
MYRTPFFVVCLGLLSYQFLLQSQRLEAAVKANALFREELSVLVKTGSPNRDGTCGFEAAVELEAKAAAGRAEAVIKAQDCKACFTEGKKNFFTANASRLAALKKVDASQLVELYQSM